MPPENNAVNAFQLRNAPLRIQSSIFRKLSCLLLVAAAARLCAAQSKLANPGVPAGSKTNSGSACASVAAKERALNKFASRGSNLVPGPKAVTLGTSAQYTTAKVKLGKSLIWSVDMVPGGNARVGTINRKGIYSTPNRMPSCGTLLIAAFDPAHRHTSSRAKEITLQATPGTASIPTVVSAVAMGTVKQNPNVIGRDGTWTAEISGKSYWLFNDTSMYKANAQGKKFISNSLAWTNNLNASNGIRLNHNRLDSSGRPTQFITFTAGEIEFNKRNEPSNGCTTKTDPHCGESYAIWPGPVLAVLHSKTGEAYDFYALLVRGGSIAGWKVLGIGIAKEKNGTWTRPTLTPGTEHPTLMWHNTSNWSGGGLVQSGYVYMSGCGQANSSGNPKCEMGRVPLRKILDLKAWTYYNGTTGKWSTDSSKATMLFYGGPSGNTIFFDPALNEYMTIYIRPESNNAVARVAPTPWGPYSNEFPLFTGKPTIKAHGAVDYAAQPHPEFEQKDGLVQYVTYVQDNRDLGWLGQDIQLVRVALAP